MQKVSEFENSEYFKFNQEELIFCDSKQSLHCYKVH